MKHEVYFQMLLVNSVVDTAAAFLVVAAWPFGSELAFSLWGHRRLNWLLSTRTTASDPDLLQKPQSYFSSFA